MTPIEYLKLAIRHYGIIFAVTLLALLSGLIYHQGTETVRYDNTVLYIIAVQDLNSATDSQENLQAADQITESIQGWFRDPAFLSSINTESGFHYTLKSKKQEKNNLLITFSSESSENAAVHAAGLEQSLRSRLAKYNGLSGLQFNFFSGGVHSSPSANQLPVILVLSVLSGLLLGFFCAWSFEKGLLRLQSTEQLKMIFPDIKHFHFRNHRHLKTAPEFLLKYLQSNFGNAKLQILNFSSKSGIGLETITRHGDFQHVDSYDIPREIKKSDPALPSIILVEFGKTSLDDLIALANLSYSKTTLVLLDQV